MAKFIPLSQGLYATVDESDFEWLSQWRWYINNVYASRWGRINGMRYSHKMHREIMQASPSVEIDHINGNKLDNRRENLRICTRSQNNCNKPKQRNNTSGFKGVWFNKRAGKFYSAIKIQKKSIYLGCFSTVEEAALAYKIAATKYHGDFAKI